MAARNPAPQRVHALLAACTSTAILLVATPAHAAAPTISGSPPTTVLPGGAYSFTATTRDADGDRLRCRLSGAPSWLGLDRYGCRVRGTAPSGAVAGQVYSNITLSVSDGRSTVSLAPFSITVAANATLRASGTPPTAVDAGAPYSFTPTLTNTTGRTATWSVANKPSWLTFSTATGALTGTPTAAQVGSYANIILTANNGATQTSLAPFTLTVKAVATTNAAPVISGNPATSAKAGSAYGFKPTASDPNGDTLTFSVTGAPAWATFSTSTGQLSGTPSSAQTGTFGNIVISVSDGKGGKASLPAFGIVVSAATTGSATLTWTPPTTTTEGGSLTNLAGYRVYYGTSSSTLTQSVSVANPGATSTVVSGLATGAWYFAVTAYTTGGEESARSGVASKTVN